jgi:hypothetical protein
MIFILFSAANHQRKPSFALLKSTDPAGDSPKLISAEPAPNGP